MKAFRRCPGWNNSAGEQLENGQPASAAAAQIQPFLVINGANGVSLGRELVLRNGSSTEPWW